MLVHVDRCDVVVVGGRVAGSLAAILFARAGLDVVIVDRATFPSATLSTHFFRGDGLIRVLDRAGLLPDVEALGAPRLTCEYVYADGDRPPLSARRRSRARRATTCRCDA